MADSKNNNTTTDNNNFIIGDLVKLNDNLFIVCNTFNNNKVEINQLIHDKSKKTLLPIKGKKIIINSNEITENDQLLEYTTARKILSLISELNSNIDYCNLNDRQTTETNHLLNTSNKSKNPTI